MRRTTAPMLLAVFAPSIAHAATCNATSSALLTTCLASANDGDVVTLTSGVTYEALAGFIVADSITLQQSPLGGAKPLIRATGTGVTSAPSLTVQTGKTLTLLDVKLDNQAAAADNRPIIDLATKAVLIGDDLQFEAQDATTLAGAIQLRDDGKLTLTDTLFNGVHKNTNGGAAIQAGRRTIVDLTNITANKGGSTGGRGGFLFANTGSTIAIRNSTFTTWSSLRGGMVYATAPASVTVTGSTFTTGRASDGGGAGDDGGCITIDNGSLSVTGGLFKDCKSDDDGGAIFVFNGSLVNDGTTYDKDKAVGDGGAFYIEGGGLDGDNLIFKANEASGMGGAIAMRGGALVRTATLDAANFTDDKSVFGGGAILLEASNMSIVGSSFTNNKVTDTGTNNGASGGAILARASDVTVATSKFTGSTAVNHGGAIRAYGVTVGPGTVNSDVTLTDTVFDTCKSTAESGGAVYIDDGTLSATKATFTACTANEDGGAIAATNADVDVTSSTFTLCTAGDDGGAMWSRDTSSTTTIDESLFDRCSASDVGGAIGEYNADVTTNSTTFLSNEALAGGAFSLVNASTLVTTASEFTTNKATNGQGGAVRSVGNSTLTFDSTIFDSNTATSAGGAVRSTATTLTVRNSSSFMDNTAGGDGGAISIYVVSDTGNWSSLDHTYTIADADFSGNTTTANGGGAVALNGWGPLTISASSFTANHAKTAGGAVYLNPDDGDKLAGAQAITSSLFTGNIADTDGGAIWVTGLNTSKDSNAFDDNYFGSNLANIGGGIYVDATTSVNVRRNTLCDNHADSADGGGIYVGSTIDTGSSTRTIANNFFVESRSKAKGGAIYLGDKDVPVTNNLFLTNKADNNNEGGGIWLESDGAILRNNLFLGAVEGDGIRLPQISNTKEEYNGFAGNLDNNRWVNGAAVAPGGTSFTFSTAPSFFSYVTGTPGDAVGCAAADFRMWMWPDASQSAYPAPVTKNAGSTAVGSYTDLDGSTNDIGPFGGSAASPAWWSDGDGDGAPWVYDCNDKDKTVFPGATETCNGVDEDCDKLLDDNATVGTWYKDNDGDGYGNSSSTLGQCTQPTGYVNKGGDCDDVIGAINPGALEKCDGIDNDCNGTKDDNATDATAWYADTDKDTYGDPASSAKSCVQPADTTDLSKATDCDDKVAATNPAASETCNGQDDNCNKLVDDGATDAKNWYSDADKDGQGDNTAIPVKQCSAPAGYVASNTDCNDASATTFLGATETCNKIDDDCDGTADDGLTTASWYGDGDGDSYGAGTAVVDCQAPGAGFTKQAGDCNDANAAINPSASDATCNSVDDDCNAKVDDKATFSDWYEDKDADKYGTATKLNACAQPTGYASATGDCNDTSGTIHPGAVEACNLVDDDCNGKVDDNVATYTYYLDSDGDGYGANATTKTDCKAPTGYVIAGGDCDDTSKGINPGAAEKCADTIDSNCDGNADAGAIDAPSWYVDSDKDSFGDPSSATAACAQPPGTVANAKDCDDKSASVLDGVNWYGDGDLDGYGDPTDLAYQCTAPPGYLADKTDCNDVDGAIHPNAGERCATAGVDDDCDTLVDDADPGGVTDGSTWIEDADNDTYGSNSTSAITRVACSRPAGFAGNASDCDDKANTTRPGAPEQCDSIDNNCNGTTDENVTFEPWYADADADGFGDALADAVIDCVAPAGYTDNTGDCNDAKAAINPNAPELCATLGVDDDCDGEFDEADSVDQIAYYLDEDGDDWAVPEDEILACEQPPNHSTQIGDCDDIDIAVNPDAPEACNGVDDDCDGRVDEGLGSQIVYTDADGDGFGDDATETVVCRPPDVDESDVGGDCDDGDDTVNPDATEIWYDGTDSDCQGDDDDDQDHDGVPIGDQPGEDCDDTDPAIGPNAVEIEDDGIDQDCNGSDATSLPDEDRPLDTDLIEDTGLIDVRGDACGCITPPAGGAPSVWGLTALAAAIAGWRRARRVPVR